MLNKLCYRVFPSLCVFVWTDENDLKTLGMDTYFFKKRGKDLRFQKYLVRVDDSSKRSSLRKQPTFCVAKLNVGFFLKRRKKRRQWFITLLPACSNIIIEEFIYDKKI